MSKSCRDGTNAFQVLFYLFHPVSLPCTYSDFTIRMSEVSCLCERDAIIVISVGSECVLTEKTKVGMETEILGLLQSMHNANVSCRS